MSSTPAKIALIVAFAAALVGVVFMVDSLLGGRSGSGGIVKIGGPFTLVDHDGNARSDRDFRGAPLLVFFGYT